MSHGKNLVSILDTHGILVLADQVKYSPNDKNISLETCPSTVQITSSGLAKAHLSSELGQYIQEGTSNGYAAYKNNAGYYLHFTPNRSWGVSKNIR